MVIPGRLNNSNCDFSHKSGKLFLVRTFVLVKLRIVVEVRLPPDQSHNRGTVWCTRHGHPVDLSGARNITFIEKETMMQILRKLVVLVLLGLPAAVLAGGEVDINTADKETLMTLSGVGESFAQKIINYRERNGGFKTVQELTNIRGIGQALVDKNKDILTAGEPAD